VDSFPVTLLFLARLHEAQFNFFIPLHTHKLAMCSHSYREVIGDDLVVNVEVAATTNANRHGRAPSAGARETNDAKLIGEQSLVRHSALDWIHQFES
jgi:hypothetical protein